MKPGHDFPVAEEGELDPKWCMCNYQGHCIACRIEVKVFEYFGNAGLAFLRKKLAGRKDVTVTEAPSKQLIRRTGESSFEVIE